MKEKLRQSSFISHTVTVKIEGLSLEKFISKAIGEGVIIKDLSFPKEYTACLKVTYLGYLYLKSMAKSKVKITKLKECGAKYSVKNFVKKKLLITGILIFVLTVFSQSLFIREINVVGCESVPEDKLRTCLKESGLYEGAFKKIDYGKVTRGIYKNFDDIVWAKVGVLGGYVEVQIAESQSPKEKDAKISNKLKSPCNIVAEKDCYIERVYTYRGDKKVSPGDFVPKGGILISGKMNTESTTLPEGEGKKVTFVHAGGEVTARVPYYFSVFADVNSTEKECNQKVREWIAENIPENAEILNKSLNFDKKENIIKVYGVIETRQKVGIEKEIKFDNRKPKSGN